MKPLVVANWKMNPVSEEEAVELAGKIKNNDKAEVVICPPFIFLSSFEGIKKGAQDIFWEKEGSFTGEVSPLMLKDLGCDYVIIGHSERRKYFSETDEIVNKKARAALDSGLTPIICIGEREGEDVEEVLKREIKEGLKDLDSFVLAYEPIWAIGTGNACKAEEASSVREKIRDILRRDDIPLLYGGSVKSGNAEGYVKEAGFDGLLVGGASLDAEEFNKIVEKAA